MRWIFFRAIIIHVDFAPIKTVAQISLGVSLKEDYSMCPRDLLGLDTGTFVLTMMTSKPVSKFWIRYSGPPFI